MVSVNFVRYEPASLRIIAVLALRAWGHGGKHLKIGWAVDLMVYSADDYFSRLECLLEVFQDMPGILSRNNTPLLVRDFYLLGRAFATN